jgi:hypothetical protein
MMWYYQIMAGRRVEPDKRRMGRMDSGSLPRNPRPRVGPEGEDPPERGRIKGGGRENLRKGREKEQTLKQNQGGKE